MELSAVSKSWYDFLGSAVFFMDKIVLGMRSDWNILTKEEANILKEGREYRNVLVSSGTDELKWVQEVMEAKLSCVDVEIHQTNFLSPGTFTKLVMTFEASVQVLRIDAVKIFGLNDESVKLNFVSLKTLKLDFCSREIMKMFLSQCITLETLELCYPRMDKDETNTFADIQPLQHLKTLRLRCTSNHSQVFHLGPNVEVLELWKIDDSMAECIAASMKRLKRVNLVIPRKRQVDQLLPNIKWT